MQIAINLRHFLFQNQSLNVSSIKKKEDENPITREIEDTLEALNCTRRNFEFETDEDIIEALIFEERSLLARYKFLLESAKKNGVRCSHASRLIKNKKLQG